jgi:hypothetical protein
MRLNDRWRAVGLGFTLASAACGPREAAAPGASQVVVSDAPPPATYVKLRTLEVTSGKGCGVLGVPGSPEDAEAKLKNEALKLGATYVQITGAEKPPINHQCLEHEHKLRGLAYRPAQAPPPARATSPSAPASTPGKPAAE